jgi:hypothetical protein
MSEDEDEEHDARFHRMRRSVRARLQIPDQFGSGHGGNVGYQPYALTRRVSRCVVCSLLQLTFFPMDWNGCIDDANTEQVQVGLLFTEQVQAGLLFTEQAHKANGNGQDAGGKRTGQSSIQSRRAIVVSPRIPKCLLGDEVFIPPPLV